MTTSANELKRFHLLGRPVSTSRHGPTELVAALLAPYRDLAALRYDYPLVLTNDPPYVHSLTDVINETLSRVAPRGTPGARVRRHVLLAEEALRRLLDRDGHGSLTELWDVATNDLLSSAREADDTDDPGVEAGTLAADLELAGSAFTVDGSLVACDERAASRLIEHVWRSLHDVACARMGRRLDELILGLSGILRADDERSVAGRSPDHLESAMGGNHRSAFDFEKWSEILQDSDRDGSMPTARRDRLRSVLTEMQSQRFFPLRHGSGEPGDDRYPFHFRSCVAAADAYQRRLPTMVALVRAIAIGELELENRYQQPEHDAYFRAFDVGSLTTEDLELFPSYLVTISDVELAADERTELFDLLDSTVPVKILVTVGEILDELPSSNGSNHPSGHHPPLATMAMALGSAHVLQTASSHLPQMRESVLDGINFTGPALFSVFTGSPEGLPSIPAYLSAAAAVQSRVVPAFSFDPAAGFDWADRLSLESNPRPEAMWPVGQVAYADAELQRGSETAAFTVIDYAAMDGRFSGHFTVAPPDSWGDDMVPAAELIGSHGDDSSAIPYVLMVSGDDTLHRVVVDHQLIRAAQHVRDTWHSLQELAGIDNSHARALLAAERLAWEEEKAQEIAALGADETPTAPAVIAAAGADDAAVDEPPAGADEPSEQPPPSDEPYIETARCTTCDECTELNPGMFAYDDNKQAYIADLTAGSYRDMVVAAEACQVAIIHPGKPWDPSESGIDELVARAAAFA